MGKHVAHMFALLGVQPQHLLLLPSELLPVRKQVSLEVCEVTNCIHTTSEQFPLLLLPKWDCPN